MPPATSRPAWPSSTYWAAVAMALSPERQTLLTVRAGTVIGILAREAACLALPGLEDVAHDHVLDRPGGDTGPAEGGPDGVAAELDRGQPGQHPTEPPDGRPGPGTHHRLGSLEHGWSPFACARPSLPPGVGWPA